MTQLRAFGAFTGARYGSFAGKTQAGRSVGGTLTQARAFGALSGRRYGSFGAKTAAHPVVIVNSGSMNVRSRRNFLREQQLAEDELLLLAIAGLV